MGAEGKVLAGLLLRPGARLRRCCGLAEGLKLAKSSCFCRGDTRLKWFDSVVVLLSESLGQAMPQLKPQGRFWQGSAPLGWSCGHPHQAARSQ